MDGGSGDNRNGVVEDSVIWVDQGIDPLIIYEIRNSMRRYIDRIVNFGEYVSRTMNNYGIINEYSSKITPLYDGYTITITVKLKGIRRDVYGDLEEFAKRLRLEMMFPRKRYRRKTSEEPSEDIESDTGPEPEPILEDSHSSETEIDTGFEDSND